MHQNPQDLCEILEERSIGKPTIFTTQLPLDHWSEVIADPVIADAARDRLQHSALTINITGETYRGRQSTKTCQQEKGRVRIVAFGSAGSPFTVVPNLGNQAVPNREILHFALQGIGMARDSAEMRYRRVC